MKPKERLDKRNPNMVEYGTSPYDLDNAAGFAASRKDKLAAVMSPAETITKRFGGAYRLCEALNLVKPEGQKKIHPSTIYRWDMPREKGGYDGHIPPAKVDLIIKAARYVGVMIVKDDFIPKAFYVKSSK